MCKMGYRKRKTSVYRGVSKHARSQRYDAYIWLPSAKGSERRRGTQQYLGGFEREVDAARTYDLARVMLGPYTADDLNMPDVNYEDLLRPLRHLSFHEYIRHVHCSKSRGPRAKAKTPTAPDDEALLWSCAHECQGMRDASTLW